VAEQYRVPDINSAGIFYAKATIATGTTDGSVVAAVTGKKIRVLAVYAKNGATATSITFNSGSTAISAVFTNGANGDVLLPYAPVGWFETTSGAALTATTSGAGASHAVQVVYTLVPGS
jgi:hypothetical protein